MTGTVDWGCVPLGSEKVSVHLCHEQVCVCLFCVQCVVCMCGCGRAQR